MQDYSQDKQTEIEIMIPQYPDELSVAFGTITRMDKENIYYNVSTNYGSSGSSILLMDNLKIIGIHKQRQNYSNENGGTFIKGILEYIEEEKNLRNYNMLEEEKELRISNLELINTIRNDDITFREIIFLKDGRLCSMDNKSNIYIYNQKNYKVEIEINYSALPDKYINLENPDYSNSGDYKMGCTDDNELFFYAKKSIFIALITQEEYKIIQQFPIKHYEYSNLYLYENNIILCSYNDYCEFEKKGNEYKLIENYFGFQTESFYKEKFEFNGFIVVIGQWSQRTLLKFDLTNKKTGSRIDDFGCFGSFHKNQKVFIEPSFLILGDEEHLFYLGENIKEIDKKFIHKKAFKNNDFYNLNGYEFKISYENLSNSSFIYLSNNSFLSQINIIKNEKDFDLNVIEERTDIKGSFFIRKGDILYVLLDNKINIYHF